MVGRFWLENRSDPTWHACIQLQKHSKMFTKPLPTLKHVCKNASMPYLAIFSNKVSKMQFLEHFGCIAKEGCWNWKIWTFSTFSWKFCFFVEICFYKVWETHKQVLVRSEINFEGIPFDRFRNMYINQCVSIFLTLAQRSF